ncbi:DUF2865 domain-containing protein [Chelatococcus sambhunathii]|uniref:DUF2865 domain-containing protein n=1 Tax=Chelatococcus sambhunathii TaxID=363953 RepID=A0ABU1DDH4_9HYPH|nr:DUF2865 domain-containing protein [Chelatococcus sambhunathii]MDR4306168.1 DUF2865 domain-containing protein [Chelatococcus sambhunathii]
MRSRLLTLAVLAVLSLSGGARAQDDPDAPEGGDPSAGQQCLGLEAQLAALDRSGPKRPDPRQIEQQIAKLQNDYDRTSAYSKGIGCGRRFIFAPEPPAECGPLEGKMKQMQVSLDRLIAQRSQAGQQTVDPRRRELLFALARNKCGPQYRLVERKIVTREPSQQKRGFFEMLFGGGGGQETVREETVVEPEMSPGETPRVSTYRTVCVRTCDGFFFPISYQTTRNAFKRDEAICQATCPGAEAKLFAYGNPGGKMENAADVDGQPYTKLENAFRYRKEFVAGCSCKPEGMNWAEALSGVDDKTVKKGDIVVDQQTAEAMARAKTPEEQAKIQAEAKAKADAAIAKAKAARTAEAQERRRRDPETEGADQTGATSREAPADDVIILDQPRADRRPVERAPLDERSFETPPDLR